MTCALFADPVCVILCIYINNLCCVRFSINKDIFPPIYLVSSMRMHIPLSHAHNSTLDFWGAFQYQKISLPKISLPKMSFGLVQSGWGESECFNKNLAPGSSEVFKDIFRAYRNAPQAPRNIESVAPEHKIPDRYLSLGDLRLLTSKQITGPWFFV